MMKHSAAPQWLVLAISVLAIVLGPLNAASSRASIEPVAMNEMSNDMTCCPNGQPVTPDCQKACQLLVACTANYATALPFNSPMNFEFPIVWNLDKPNSDFINRPVGIKPPARPPRT